jgi:hypothetical protein
MVITYLFDYKPFFLIISWSKPLMLHFEIQSEQNCTMQCIWLIEDKLLQMCLNMYLIHASHNNFLENLAITVYNVDAWILNNEWMER